MIATRQSILRALSAGLGAALAPQAAHSAPPELSSHWTWNSPADVVWAEARGPEALPCVLVLTIDGRLHALETSGGHELLKPALAVGADAQLAEPLPEAGLEFALLFDRQGLYGLRLAPRVAVAWQIGGPPPPAESYPDDPEKLHGWKAACVMQANGLAVRDDGHVLLMDSASGRELWCDELGPLPLMRLQACGKRACILSRSQGQVRAAIINLAVSPPTLSEIELDDVWPVWSALVPEGLLTVSPREAALWSLDSNAPRRRVIAEGASRASAVAVHASEKGETTLFLAAGPQPVAIDLTRKERLWPRNDVAVNGYDLNALTCTDAWLMGASDVGAAAYDLGSGAFAGACLRDGCTYRGAAVRGDALWVAHEPSRALGVGWTLARVPLARASATAPSVSPEAELWRLARAESLRPRGTTWTARGCVVVGADGLSLYDLPDNLKERGGGAE